MNELNLSATNSNANLSEYEGSVNEICDYFGISRLDANRISKCYIKGLTAQRAYYIALKIDGGATFATAVILAKKML